MEKNTIWQMARPLLAMAGVFIALMVTVIVAGLVAKRRGVPLKTLAEQLQPQPLTKRYKSRGSPLTRAEIAFYGVLAHAVYPQLIVFPKIRVSDLIETTADVYSSEGRKAWNHVAQKHVDFVLCEPASLGIVAVLELDDKSHDRPDRKRRDALIDQAFADADIRVLHIQCQNSYSQPDTRRIIFSELGIVA